MQTLIKLQDTHETNPEYNDTLKEPLKKLDELCSNIAAQFNLYGRDKKPRKAFIIDTLAKNVCYGCIIKELTKANTHEEVDALYLENHQLAVNLLIETLREQLEKVLCVEINGEVAGEYGRTDIEVKAYGGGVVINSRDKVIVIEVKTGAGLSYHQAFRYLIEKPNSILLIWRVTKQQLIKLYGAELKWLLSIWLKTVLHKGSQITTKPFECNHISSNKPWTIKNPQKIVTDFITGLKATLPIIVNEIKQFLNTPASPNLQTASVSVNEDFWTTQKETLDTVNAGHGSQKQ